MGESRSWKGYAFEHESYDVIGACIEVQRVMGLHCMEVDYQRGLELALRKRGIVFAREVEIPITFEGTILTKRRVDFVISGQRGEFLLELKARTAILDDDIEQCLLYLRQGNYPLCLLINFGQRPLGKRRLVHTIVGPQLLGE